MKEPGTLPAPAPAPLEHVAPVPRQHVALPAPVSMDVSAERIARLEGFIASDASPSAKARAHLHLARIFLRFDNPNADYDRATRELEAYISLMPPSDVDPSVLDWLTVLWGIQLQKDDQKKLRAEQDRLRSELQRLIRENESLQVDLRRLKELDLWMEQQRRVAE